MFEHNERNRKEITIHVTKDIFASKLYDFESPDLEVCEQNKFLLVYLLERISNMSMIQSLELRITLKTKLPEYELDWDEFYSEILNKRNLYDTYLEENKESLIFTSECHGFRVVADSVQMFPPRETMLGSYVKFDFVRVNQTLMLPVNLDTNIKQDLFAEREFLRICAELINLGYTRDPLLDRLRVEIFVKDDYVADDYVSSMVMNFCDQAQRHDIRPTFSNGCPASFRFDGFKIYLIPKRLEYSINSKLNLMEKRNEK